MPPNGVLPDADGFDVALEQEGECRAFGHTRVDERRGEENIQEAEHGGLCRILFVGQAIIAAHGVMQPSRRLEWNVFATGALDERKERFRFREHLDRYSARADFCVQPSLAYSVQKG